MTRHLFVLGLALLAEGQSHARDASAPETKEAFEGIARFFDKHLTK
jgi:hypothetical protein